MSVVIRHFQAGDAEAIRALFQTVYGDLYVYPDIYLPSMIRHHNQQQRWRTVVAVRDEHIVGHAVLWRDPLDAQSAELAMFAVHPSARGDGISNRLGQYLCDYAQRLGLATLTIKMVSSHERTQHLARKLGFHTTGLLLDYVASPFSLDARESIILGVLPLQARPVPLALGENQCADWAHSLAERFGVAPTPLCDETAFPMQISTRDQRIDVTLDKAAAHYIGEIANLPVKRLTHLRIRMDPALPSLLPLLHQVGYADMGLAPASGEQWYWLLARGYGRRELNLYCPVARSLYSGASQDSAAEKSGKEEAIRDHQAIAAPAPR